MASSATSLILICGLPGSGKTTLARQLVRELNALALSGDEWMAQLGIDLWDEATRDRIERLFWALAQDLLRHEVSVILDSGFWLRSDRDEKRAGARALEVRVELRYLPTPTDELVRRLEVRNAQGGRGTASISRADIEGWLPLFQVPDDEELALFDAPIESSPSN
jgi:predicted kinase